MGVKVFVTLAVGENEGVRVGVIVQVRVLVADLLGVNVFVGVMVVVVL